MPLRLPSRDSLAGRLFVSAALWSIGILFIAGLILSTLHRSYAERAFDDRLDVYLKALVADVAVSGEGEKGPVGDLGEPRFRTPLSGWYWQVVRLASDNFDAMETRTSPSLLSGRLPISETYTARLGSGGREVVAPGTDERVLRLVESYIDIGEEGRYIIAVAGDPAEIRVETRRFGLALAITFSVLAIALLISSAFQVRFGLRPLLRLQASLAAIRRGEADHIDGHYPQEVAPLADELNQLVSANKEIVERARTQVGNLAHALKTPLSVLTNEAEATKNPLGVKVREQAALMRSQVQYYLDRARAATRAVSIGAVTEVTPAIERLVRAFAKIHGQHGILFDAHIAPGLIFRGEKQDFDDIIGNLADNAGKWAHAKVLISARQLPVAADARPMLEFVIADDGPGLPPDKRQEALRRGRRLDETKPGSGLGLSIVADLVTLYGGSIAFEDNPGGGLLARVTLPSIER